MQLIVGKMIVDGVHIHQGTLQKNDRRHAVGSPEIEIRQSWKWFQHRRERSFHATSRIENVNIGYSISVFECRNNVLSAFFTFRLIAVKVKRRANDGDGKWRPDIQGRLHRCYWITDDPQVQTLGRCKDDTSPSSTHVGQRCPLPLEAQRISVSLFLSV